MLCKFRDGDVQIDTWDGIVLIENIAAGGITTVNMVIGHAYEMEEIDKFHQSCSKIVIHGIDVIEANQEVLDWFAHYSIEECYDLLRLSDYIRYDALTNLLLLTIKCKKISLSLN